ncbi:hypothetical protein [Gordonia zhenghanii]|nr:hypothetical protein [Gordonia zhenghanii]
MSSPRGSEVCLCQPGCRTMCDEALEEFGILCGEMARKILCGIEVGLVYE